jgi:hypothetical protein
MQMKNHYGARNIIAVLNTENHRIKQVVFRHSLPWKLCKEQKRETKVQPAVSLKPFDGNSCLETFLAKFENHSENYGWNENDRLFHLKEAIGGEAEHILWEPPNIVSADTLIAVLRRRFGTENQAERFRAELWKRRRSPGETLMSLRHSIRGLVSQAYPGSWNNWTELTARDAFLSALDDEDLRYRIMSTCPPPQTLDTTFELAIQLEAIRPLRPETERKIENRGIIDSSLHK